MMKSLKLTVVQFTPKFGKKTENLNRIENLIQDLKTDIIVLPELCTTGYYFLSREEVEAVAEPAAGPTGTFFHNMSRKHNTVIVAGFAERSGNHLFNSCLIAIPEREKPDVYRKTHLFYKEQLCFDPGNTGFFVVEDTHRDIRLGPMICYDWRFPESARVLTLLGADLIVCPSNLITEAWKVVMPARAIENKVYVAVSNRAGTEKRGDEELHFKGNSVIYDYNGMALCKANPLNDEILTVEIYPWKTRNKFFNPINDVLGDRQPQYYGRLAEG